MLNMFGIMTGVAKIVLRPWQHQQNVLDKTNTVENKLGRLSFYLAKSMFRFLPRHKSLA